MHVWTLIKWEKTYVNSGVRTGLRLRCDKDVDPEVKRACKEFCNWLRENYYFPIRVPIYLKSTERIKGKDGELVSATFTGPYNKYLEPYIRVSAGDYNELLEKNGKDNALAAYLVSIAHELTHYFQWINDLKLTEMGEERQANQYSYFLLDEYAETRDHP